jgi:hypothetical protein
VQHVTTKTIIRLRHAAQAAVIGCAWLYVNPSAAQEEEGTTPGAIANPGSYQGSTQLQQQEQQQYQQQDQQNQQMLQRLNENYQQSAPNGAGGSAGGSSGHAAPAINWWNRPALAPEKNPLLGRWQQVAAKTVTAQHTGNPLDLVGSVVDSSLAGGCKSMFGSGVIAFEPTALQWVAPDGHEEILNHVAYRANGADVIVLTKDPGAVPALVFGFPDHDRSVVAFFNCTMNRVGARSPTAVAHAVVASAGAAPSGPANAVLDLQAAEGAGAHPSPFANAQFWVTAEDPANALQSAGAESPAGKSLGEFLNEDCRSPANCVRDWNAMTGKALGSLRTDAAGHARTPPLPPGRYYIVGMAPFQAKALFWSLPIDARPGTNPVMLNPANGTTLRQ